MYRHPITYPALFSLLYTAGGWLLLMVSDALLSNGLWDAELWPNTLKNMALILISGGLLYTLLHHQARNMRRAHQQQQAIAEQLRRARDELEQRVAERTAALLAANQELEQQIASRAEVESALRDSEERFRQLAEHIREVFWVYDIAERRSIYFSPAYEEIWGRTTQAALANPLDWLEAVHPDDQPRIQKAHLAKHQYGYFNVEYRILRPDGSLRWIWDRGFPVRNAAGQIYRIAGLAEDITARKLEEDQLRRQQVDLAQMARLSVAVELASNLAHELNQPLAAIVAYTQASLALLQQHHADPQELVNSLEAVIKQSLRLGEIIRHVRALVRRQPTVQASLNLNAVLHAVLHYLQLEVRQAAVEVHWEVADDLPQALADDLQVQLVLVYLVRNALEALLEVPKWTRYLTIRATQSSSERLLVTVCDSGRGIAPSVADRLFQPFFTTKPGNMGLSLSVSRSIIEAQGGELWATPNPEGGVSFCFTLPIHVGTTRFATLNHELNAHRLPH